MKTNEFFDAMGKIDPALIERAERKVVKKSPIIKIAAIAATFALLVAGLVAALPMLIGDEEEIVEDVIVWENIFAMFSPGHSAELIEGEGQSGGEIIIAEKVFAEIVSEDYSDYKIGSAILVESDGTNIGEKLGEVEIRSGWYLRAEDKETDVTVVKAEVYEIGGVARKAAVAIRYLEKCAANSDFFPYFYYVAVNENYELTTLSEYFSDLNADAYMNMSETVFLLEVSADAGAGINIDKYKFKAGASEKMRDLILSLDGAGEVVGSNNEAGVKIKKGTRALELNFRLETAKNGLCFMSVFENGSIAINGLGDGVAVFHVGVDATDALFAAFEENCVPDAGLYGADDLVEATTGEVNE